jgi:hypothetical protein
MPFSIRPYRRFPVYCAVTYHAGPFLKLPLAYLLGLGSLITLLVLSSGPAYAEWVAIEKQYQSPGRQTVYVDPDTIRREGHLVTMEQLIDFKTMQGGRSPTRFSSTKIEKEFDCADKRLRVLALTDFWGNMGTGEAAGAAIGGGHWIPVEPESLNYALWKVACNKQ